MPPFSIIIPVLNHPSYTQLCLDSVVTTSAEIIVVDNGSRERTRRVLESFGARIKVLRNETNQGIGQALNQGVAAASSNQIVMLHNDCIVPFSFEKDVLVTFEQMPAAKLQLVSPTTNYCDEGTFVYSKDLINTFVANKLSNKSHPTVDDIYEVITKTYQDLGGFIKFTSQFDAPKISKTAEISSFCLLAFRDVFQKMGGFSSEYQFRGYEDKDLLFRYAHEGYECGKSTFFVHHFGNITSDGHGFEFPSLMAANREKFLAAKQRYVKGSNGGIRPWTAVLFPDPHPEITARAKENLSTLNFKPAQLIEVPSPGIFPMRKAWEWVLPQVRHNIVGQIDGDMLLNLDAPQQMVSSLMVPSAAMAAAFLDDVCVGKMGHLIFWKTSFLKSIQHEKTPPIDWETFYLQEIAKQNLEVIWIDKILGQHAIKLDPFTVFKAFLRRGIKTKLRKFENAANEIERAFKKGSPWSHLALLAFHCGIQLEYNADPHDENFNAFAWSHYEKVEPFCKSILSGVTLDAPKSQPKDTRIKVAILSDNLNIGGVEMIIKIIDDLIDRTKFKPYLYARLGGDLENSFNSDTVIRIADNQSREMSVSRVREWIIQDEIEVTLAMHFWGTDDLFGNGKTCRVIERTDGMAGWYVKKPGIADLAVFESETLIQVLSPYPCEAHKVIHNGRHPFVRNEEIRSKLRAQLGITNEVIISSIARICNDKKQSDMILAAEELVRRGCTNFKLVMMGPDQEQRRAGHEEVIRQKNLTNFVTFMDPSFDVSGLLSASDMSISASIVEGVSGSLVEACLAGLPIVATNVGATSDVVKDNGALVPPEKPVELAAAIEPFLRDETKRKMASLASLALAKTTCSAEKMVKEFEEVIEQQHREHLKDQDTLLTIIIPVWTRHEFLEKAMLSVLNQTHKNWKLIVSVDDLTPTKEVLAVLNRVKDPRISYVTSPHKNQSAAMNVGMRYVRTKYALRLDSDDELPLDAVEVVLSHIQKHPEVGYFYSEKKYIDSNGKDVSDQYETSVAEEFSPARLEECFITKSVHVWKKADFILAGGFAEDIVYGEDYLLPLMMMLYGTKFMPIHHPCYLCRYDHDAGNISKLLTTKEKEASVATVKERYRKIKETLGVSWERP